MTATTPRRGPSTPVGGPTVSLTRTYRLYRFYDCDGVELYVGITGRVPLERLLEHLRTKRWAPEIACWEVDPRVFRTEAEVLAAEKAAIIAERPKYNVAHNGNNPGRAAVRVAPRRPAVQPSPAEVVLSSRWTWWAVLYLAAVGVSWWLLARADAAVSQVAVSTRWHAGVALALPVAVVLLAWWWWATSGRRRWRKLRRLVR